MAEKIAFENGRISNFQGLVALTLTLTLDRVILHTVVHHLSTSTCMPNFVEIEKTFCGRTDGQKFETHFITSTQKSRHFVIIYLLTCHITQSHRRKYETSMNRTTRRSCPWQTKLKRNKTITTTSSFNVSTRKLTTKLKMTDNEADITIMLPIAPTWHQLVLWLT